MRSFLSIMNKYEQFASKYATRHFSQSRAEKEREEAYRDVGYGIWEGSDVSLLMPGPGLFNSPARTTHVLQ